MSIINQQVCTYLIRNITFARENGMKVKTLYAFARAKAIKVIAVDAFAREDDNKDVHRRMFWSTDILFYSMIVLKLKEVLSKVKQKKTK